MMKSIKSWLDNCVSKGYLTQSSIRMIRDAMIAWWIIGIIFVLYGATNIIAGLVSVLLAPFGFVLFAFILAWIVVGIVSLPALISAKLNR